MDSKTKNAILRKAVKRIEDETFLVWPAFPGLARQIARIVLDVQDEMTSSNAKAA